MISQSGILSHSNSTSFHHSYSLEIPNSEPSNELSGTPLITVVDVYDLAASIGKEFENIIDHHGPEVVSNLMPKVISVLEQLESFVAKFDTESSELMTLQLAIHRLELEKSEKAREKTRNEKEIEDLESTWQSEARELHELIQSLQQENEQLKNAIREKSNRKDIGTSVTNAGVHSTQEIQLMLRLKDLIDRQKLQLRSLRHQLSQMNVDMDAMQQQVTRLAKLNAVLRRQRCISKRRTEQLVSEKRDLEMKLQAREDLIEQIRTHIQPHSGDQSLVPTPTIDMTSSMLKELTAPVTPPTEMTESQLIERLNNEDKMISGTNGKNYTVQEFRDLLIERNELKSRIIEVDEEISIYRQAGDEDPPVQGPINREPYEKLYGHPPRAIGIKQFFENLFIKLSS